MPLNRLFDAVERVRDTAQWRAAFGEPQVFEDRTVIPVAQVGYGFGLGFGHPAEVPEDEEVLAAEGQGGVGGGAMSRPLGAIVVSDDDVYFEEAVDANKIALAGILLAGVIVVQAAATLRALLSRR
ncbi:MAG: spore germination protein GerW family protein [Anaerolineae bacterium]|jgi:uncharacterized spore protein YtfJ|nr:spore germination protein GerW family protein [Anaerolineae bacterium]MDX9829626.1 spore germination protein GerW family protein [Anaerolineae bacterium]